MLTKQPFTIYKKDIKHLFVKNCAVVYCNTDVKQEMFAFDTSYIVFHYGKYSINEAKKGRFTPPKMYIKSARTTCLTLSSKANSSYVVLGLQPDTFYQITKRSASKNMQEYLPLGTFINEQLTEAMYKAIAKEQSPEKVVALFDFYTEKYFKNWQEPITIKNALQIINQNLTNDNTLNEVLTKTPYSVSTLNRYFKKYIGTTVGEYIRLVKFNTLINYLLRDDINLKDLTNIYGFYDQSHLKKDFKKFAGITPSKYKGPNYELLHKVFTNTDDILPIT